MTEFAPFVVNTCEALAGTSRLRTHAYEPKKGKPFSPFEIYDPFGLRNAIVPVFRQLTDGRMYGMGTAFHIDGFGSFLTAYHVVDFVEQHLAGRPILFLSMHAVVFGTVCIPSDCFVPAMEVRASMMEANDPMAALRFKPVRQPAIDAALLKAEEVGPGAKAPQTLPVRTRGWVPRLGEIVLAVGFPELDLSEVDHTRQSALLTEGMCGAYGRIIAIHPGGTSRSNPTPVFEVESDWPPGMSGGPVFNRKGEVVGMVSRSLRADSDFSGVGYAVHFGLARDIEQITPGLDKHNPGWRVCWGVFADGASAPTKVCISKEEAKAAMAVLHPHGNVRLIVNRIGTAEFMELPQLFVTAD